MLKLISDNYLYIHIPKTSGSNFKNIVSLYYLGDHYIFVPKYSEENKHIISIIFENGELYEKIKKSEFFPIAQSISQVIQRELLHTVQHAPLWAWQQAEMCNTENVMTIVRNPYTRFISHYYGTLAHLKKYFEFKSLSPTEFINHKKINSILELDPCTYLKNQVDYLIDINGDIKCDKFYKMEEDLETLEKDFNLKNINEFKYKSTNYEKNYSELYTDELIEFVQKQYKRDFEYFGYDIHPFWK
jgi:hypothetical protein